MRILIVSTNLSHPIDAGNRVAIMGQVELLHQLGCEVHFLYADMALGPVDESEMRHFWKEKYHVYHMPIVYKWKRFLLDKYRTAFCNGYWKCDDHYPVGIEKYVETLQQQVQFDAIVIQYTRLSKLLSHTSIPKKAIYTHDVFSYKDQKVGSPFYETCTAHQEAKALQRCPSILAIQEEEATYYHFLAPRSRIYTVYSSYTYKEFPNARNKNILFLASRMEFNVNGIKKFLDEVWPLILRLFKDAKLLIGGSVCDELSKEDYPGTELLGQVESLDDFYQKGDIVINPVFQGSGLKIKTFEAISFGKVTIVDSHSTIGIFEKETAPLLVASTPEQWLEHISQTFNDDSVLVSFQKKDKEYISNLNRYILEPYKMFLS